MALLATRAEIQKYVPVRHDFEPKDLAIYIPKAARKYIKPFAGDLAVELKDVAEGTDAAIKNHARDLLSEALASFSIFLGGPVLAMQINAAGFNVESTDTTKPADTFQKNEMSRTLLREAHEALDELLIYLEENHDKFNSYTESHREKAREFLVQTVAEFQKYYHIHGSRQTFLALQPTMRQVEDQFFKNWLCVEFLEKLKTTVVEGKALEAKTALQQAQVALTISKAVVEGMFIIDEKGIHLRFDRLPHEQTVALNAKNTAFLERTSKAKEEAGIEYLKIAKRIILSNPDQFTECEGNIIINQDAATGGNNIVFNDRILAL